MDETERTADLMADDSRYRLLIDSIADYAIYMLDPDGRVSSWNLGAQRFKGYEPAEIIGEHFSRFYTEEDKATELPRRALAMAADEGRFEQEGWRVRKDGERFWAHVVIDPIRAESGEILGYAKITRDLTERKAAQEALRRSEEQFRLLVQGVTDYAIYMLDTEGLVSNWNAGAERIKGYRPDEIVGQHFSRFYTDEDRAIDLPATALRLAREEGRFEREGWRLRKDGTRFWAHVIIDPIKNDAGEIIGFAKITRDVTERMEAQRELEQAREALFQSQKLEAIGQLTGGVAHDFNNLLAAVMGSLELARKRLKYDPRVTPLIDNAMQGAQRGAVLTQRMLAFARRQDLKLEAVEIPSLVRGMSDFIRRTLGSQVEVSTRFPARLPAVRSDPAQLESALLNLAVNARDAMQGAGALSIAATAERVGEGHPRLAAGDYVRLAVTDTGSGMDEQTLARATEPFFTTKGVGRGTGLGLSMVHGLAAQSGGDLIIESEVGRGTTVALWLPTAELEAEEEPDEDGAAPRDSRLTVLVVDDDDLVLLNTVAMLEDLGHEVIAAASGAEALEHLGERREIGLVVTDQMMPHMTGAQLRGAIRERRPDLPVVLVSGYADLGGSPAMDGAYLAKPFTQDELARFIDATLEALALALPDPA
jgi:PAS domain S-box-containing protein